MELFWIRWKMAAWSVSMVAVLGIGYIQASNIAAHRYIEWARPYPTRQGRLPDLILDEFKDQEEDNWMTLVADLFAIFIVPISVLYLVYFFSSDSNNRKSSSETTQIENREETYRRGTCLQIW
jgi:hypothetical protein